MTKKELKQKVSEAIANKNIYSLSHHIGNLIDEFAPDEGKIQKTTWLAVDKDKAEYKYSLEPTRRLACFDPDSIDADKLLEGSIEKILGYKLTWEDRPVKLEDFDCLIFQETD